MDDPDERAEPAVLPLADAVCLALVAEGPTHGWTLVKLLAPGGEIGRIWSLSRPLTYRSVDKLVAARLVDREPGDRRAMLTATATGRRTSEEWLTTPVEHLRELRTQFLVKLVLLDRVGRDRQALVAAQRAALSDTIASLTAEAPADPVELWRHESARAAARYLERLDRLVADPGA